MLRTTQRRMRRLIIQTKTNARRKNKEHLDGKDTHSEEMSEDTHEEDGTNDEYDQDSSISFEHDADSTSSQEDG